jgi:hypothetical protein
MQTAPAIQADPNTKITIAQIYYELFKIAKEEGDSYLSMVYINQAIE